MADNPQTDPQAPPAPEGKTLDERMGAVETEQREQRGILNRIEGLLTGPKAAPPASTTSGLESAGEPGGLTVAEQVRKGVEEIEAKKQKAAEAKAAKEADAAWRKTVEDHVAEHRPAEPRTGRKVKLQERLFGKADTR